MYWHERCVRALMVSDQTLAGATEGAAGLIDKLGFEYFSYTLETILPVNAPRSVFLNNFDGELLASVKVHRAQTVMPTALHVRRSAELLVWPLEERSPDLFWMDMRRLGVRAGWTLAANQRGNAIGRFSALRTSGQFSPYEHITELARWRTLTEVMDATVRKLAFPPELTDDAAALTREELEVLVWAADGKTSKETSQIMTISLRRVEYMRSLAAVKLGCNNITDSVVKAMTQGLLVMPAGPR